MLNRLKSRSVPDDVCFWASIVCFAVTIAGNQQLAAYVRHLHLIEDWLEIEPSITATLDQTDALVRSSDGPRERRNGRHYVMLKGESFVNFLLANLPNLTGLRAYNFSANYKDSFVPFKALQTACLMPDRVIYKYPGGYNADPLMENEYNS